MTSLTGLTGDTVRLRARVDKILHQDDDSGFCVFVAGGNRGTIGKVVGEGPALREGLKIRAEGAWERCQTRGLQFRAMHIAIVGGHDPEVVSDYIRGLGVKGIGAKTARQLVKKLGDDALETLEGEDDVPKVRGLSEDRLSELRAVLRQRQAERDVDLQLRQLGIKNRKRQSLRRHYAERAAEVVTADPWRPARELSGFGFQEAERIADVLAIPADDPRRLKGAIDRVLERARVDGHCGLPRGLAVEQICRLTRQDQATVVAALDEAIDQGIVVADTVGEVACVFQGRIAAQEDGIAAWVRTRASLEAPAPTIEAAEALVREAEGDEGLELSDSQRAALTTLLRGSAGILTGGPGVGKSTSTRVLVRALERAGRTATLAAPTGRAAKRLAEATGRRAATIHRTLGAQGSGFLHTKEFPLDCEALILDEVSMVDVPLMAATLNGIPADVPVYLVGDADQLPSVGPGRVLGDLIASGGLPVARLTEIHRQAARDSRIIALAHGVNAGVVPDLGPQRQDGDLFVIDAPESEVAASVIDLVTRRLPAFTGQPAEDIQVLSPMRRERAGTEALNTGLQRALNPASGETLEIKAGRVAVGDKVIQTVNDYERDIRNGDIGFVREVDTRGRRLRVDFPDGPGVVACEPAHLDELELAYALTVHKSQGGEYPVVVIPLVRAHRHMLRRNLLYTALTRGKQLVVLVGQRDLISGAAARVDGARRLTRLEGLLAVSETSVAA